MFKKYILCVSILIFACVSLQCAPGNDRWDPDINPGSRANFWAGLWHGLIIVIAFIVSLFTNTVGIYEVNNVGWGYNLGFIIGVSIVFGCILRSQHHKKHHMTKRDWNKIGSKIEEKVRTGIKKWLDEADQKEAKEKEWEEIASRIEQKIKDALKDWD